MIYDLVYLDFSCLLRFRYPKPSEEGVARRIVYEECWLTCHAMLARLWRNGTILTGYRMIERYRGAGGREDRMIKCNYSIYMIELYFITA